jgi:hypothetical protein
MYFFIKTQNPRPTFHLDMTAEEREIMNCAVAYVSTTSVSWRVSYPLRHVTMRWWMDPLPM